MPAPQRRPRPLAGPARSSRRLASPAASPRLSPSTLRASLRRQAAAQARLSQAAVQRGLEDSCLCLALLPQAVALCRQAALEDSRLPASSPRTQEEALTLFRPRHSLSRPRRQLPLLCLIHNNASAALLHFFQMSLRSNHSRIPSHYTELRALPWGRRGLEELRFFQRKTQLLPSQQRTLLQQAELLWGLV